MRYLSVFSGIEAFSVAVAGLEGWVAAAFAEIDAFPSAVLAHRYPDVPNLGDMTAIDVDTLGQIDWLVGGSPCQAFSIAGMRRSLDDDRGNLTLAYVRLAHELAEKNGLRGLLWENVPGVLNTKDNAFGCFVAALVGHDGPLEPPNGRGWPNAGMVAGPRARLAWRVLDSQHFGVPQRRKRVFLVADFGNGPDPATVLFEPRGQGRGAQSSGQEGQEVAGTLGGSSQSGGFRTTDLDNSGAFIVAHTLRGEGFDASEDGSGRGTPLVTVEWLGNAEGGNAEVPGAVTKSNVGKHINNQSPLVAVYDPAQVTSPHNRSKPTPELSHTLPATDKAPVVYALQAGATRENPDSGPDGLGMQADLAYTLEARPEVQFVVDTAPTLRAGGNATGGDRPPGSDVDTIETLVVVAFGSKGSGADAGELSPTLRAAGHRNSHQNGGSPPAIAFDIDQTPVNGPNAPPLKSDGYQNGVMQGAQVRRLTPRECERLQAFPDDYTLIPGLSGWRDVGDDEDVAELEAMGLTIRRTKKSNKLRVNDPDGPRYKALGNSFTVEPVNWIMVRVNASLAGLPMPDWQPLRMR